MNLPILVLDIMRPVLPLSVAMLVTLLLCTFIPEISMWLPARPDFVR